MWQEKHKNETKYAEIKKKQNKIYHKNVKEMSSESAKASVREGKKKELPKLR